MDLPATSHNLYLAHGLGAPVQAQLAEWSRVVAEEPPLPPVRWHLRRDAYLRHAAIGASIRIEGNPLTNDQTDALLEGNLVDAPLTQRIEARNYDAALGMAATFAHDPAFDWSEMVFRVVNASVMRDLDDDTQGRYREGPVSVGAVYQGPDHRTVGALMGELVRWLRATDAHPLVRTALLHLNLVAIHPWFNGNGRSARILSQLELMRLVDAPELISIEPVIEARIDAYYERIRHALGPTYAPDTHSATEWIEWYVGLHTERLEDGQRLNHATMHDIVTVLGALERSGDPSDWGPIVHLAAFGPFVTRNVMDAYGNSPSAARALTARLVGAGWIEPRGATKGRHYVGSERVCALDLRGPELVRRWATAGPLGLSRNLKRRDPLGDA